MIRLLCVVALVAIAVAVAVPGGWTTVIDTGRTFEVRRVEKVETAAQPRQRVEPVRVERRGVHSSDSFMWRVFGPLVTDQTNNPHW